MSRRTKRVAALLREELARIFLEEVSDPRLGQIAITDVVLSADLKIARVYVNSSDPKANSQETLKILKQVSPFVRHELRGLGLKFVPELRFEYDTAGDAAGRVLKLLEALGRDGEVVVEANQ